MKRPDPHKELEKIEARLIRLKKQNPHGAYATPVYRTSTFCFDTIEEGIAAFASHDKQKFVYTRLDNPSFTTLGKILSIWEGGESACLFASGMAAITATLMTFLKSGDHLICNDVLYGCTDELLARIIPKFKIEVDFIDTSDLELVKKALKPNTKMALIETPANPTMDCTDIYEFCRIVNKYNPKIIKVIDNTFATPYNQRPLTLGADLVIHSLTKYLNGHGDLIAGAVIGLDGLVGEIKHLNSLIGATLSPDNAALIERGLKTFGPRMEIHNNNARQLARLLSRHHLVQKVYYPEFNEIARRQMTGFGGMISFELKDAVKENHTKKFLNYLGKLGIKLAVSLGDTDTLIQWPAKMTHTMIPKEKRAEKGITENMLRLSVGIEPYEILEGIFQKSLRYLEKL